MIYLYGAYGTGNLGDDAILTAALEIYGRTNCRIVAYGAPLLEIPCDFIMFADFLRDPGHYLASEDELIFAGGGLFWADVHIEQMLRFAVVAKSKNCLVRMERVGAQGVEFALKSAEDLFSLCDNVSVRDKGSLEIIREYGLCDKATYSPDFATNIQWAPLQRKKASKLLVGINHSDIGFLLESENRNRVLEIYNKVSLRCQDFAQFVYVPQTRHFSVIEQNDVIVGEYFWQYSRGRISSLSFPSDVGKFFDYLSSLDLMLGWRYHALLLAKQFGAKSVCVGPVGDSGYQDSKYLAFARENALPLIDLFCDLERAVDEISGVISQFANNRNDMKSADV